MSTPPIEGRLPDPVYGSADVHASDHHRIKASATVSDRGHVLLHAHLGGLYIAMSERNWQHLFATLGRLEVVAPPVKTHRIRFNDADGTATIDTVIA